MDRSDLAEQVLDVVEPSLHEFCREAGEPGAYNRLQTALYRYKRGSGRGVPEKDVEWVQEALQQYSL